MIRRCGRSVKPLRQAEQGGVIMGIMGYSGINPFHIGRSTVRRITIQNRDGSVAGTIGVSKPTKGRFAKGKKKKLQYNFKQISSQIMRTKKAAGAGQVVSSARQKVASLRRVLYSGQYDDTELKLAIKHAESILRVAKKRKKHLQEEENAGKRSGLCQAELEEEQMERMEEMEEYPSEELSGISEEEMRQLMQELQEEMRDLMEESMEDLEQAVSEDSMMVDRINMDPEDLETLKKKHRAEEWKEILEADMKYLKALFNKYQQERKNAGSSSGSGETGDSRSSGSSQNFSDSVSLELGGAEVPVTAAASAPVVTEGAGMDTLV